MPNKFNFDRVIKNLERVKTTLPQQLANTTRNFFIDENFDKQQFAGRKWAPVKRYGKKGSSRNNSAPLVQTGKLRRAINNSLVKADFGSIVFRVTESTGKAGFNYAAVHNEGLRAGRGKGFQMPQRKFMGQSDALTKVQREKISHIVDKIWGA